MPNQPPPVQINHPLLFGLGTGLWALALAVLAILYWGFDQPVGRWLWVCLVGLVLGVVGVIYSRHSWRAKH
ncbi:MAG: DUF2530 domain-containing protein [Micrococcales bacterium]|nr:DUF2530 domain-containing protein [Micrococcales bacterium]